MSLGLAFWIIWLITVVFFVCAHFGYISGPWSFGNWVLIFFLLTLVAWKVFGPPIHG